ncbi:hypothetical protein CSW29_13295 [Thermus scotoductus]|uniref:Zn-dependent metallo-hydrolase RNA specificity domain-containing protein n=2 Tax=Bacteria TaxID=2 RepID=A0A430UDK1_THESC|nr:MBL fold metallo-hydrolase RNA specificity domain-containing protein [Thermus scotoductus]RTH96318.1 hypothetical protein CSW29_13295 [Thermus scotoductus]
MGIALLLSEGTRLGDPAPQVGEEEVLGEALALTRKAEGRLVVADFAPRHVERLQVFLEVARETGRRLALQPKDAFLLEALAQASPLFQGVLQDPHLALYDDVKTSPRPWEKGVRERWAKVLVGPEEVARDPGGYILAFSLWDLNDLLDLPEESLREGLYLYANSPAYDEEAALDLERLRGWVRHLGLRLEGDPEGRTSRLHASGHAGEADLVALVREVRPQVLIPVHTESPGRWREVLGELGGTRVFLPQEGERVDLEGLLRG